VPVCVCVCLCMCLYDIIVSTRGSGLCVCLHVHTHTHAGACIYVCVYIRSGYTWLRCVCVFVSIENVPQCVYCTHMGVCLCACVPYCLYVA